MLSPDRHRSSWFFLILGCQVGLIFGFNLDTRFPLVFTDDSPGDTYFGFSVALHENREEKLLLAGAPRANSSFNVIGKSAVEPGVIYKCSIEKQACTELPVHLTRNVDPFKSGIADMRYDEMRDNGWLGVSLDVSSGSEVKIVACSHLWKNKRYSNDNYLTNGACYVIDSSLNSRNAKIMTPLTEKEYQSTLDYENKEIYFYGVALMGMSSHFIQDSNDLVLGAPGIHDFRGSAVYTEEDWYTGNSRKYVVPAALTDSSDTYFGYSVTSGTFMDIPSVQLAIGSPRDGPTGTVYIVNTLTSNDMRFEPRTKLKGKQMGEYFGAAVCAIDINNDGYSELLVGAPLFSESVDEGKVYLYINTQNGSLTESKEHLVGSSAPDARFGTAIAAIGDLNQDGFQDVAIGAPYEEVNGALYIYLGNSIGLKMSQKILANNLHPTLKGFGISISKGKDIDDNKYLDLAVGAYMSKEAVILRSYPVIKVKPKLQTSVDKININALECTLNNDQTVCFNVSACISYSSYNGPDQIVFSNILALGLDNERETRGSLVSGGDPTHQIKFDMLVFKDQLACKSFSVHIMGSTTNFLTPVSFNLTTAVEQDPALQTSFCSICAMRDNMDNDVYIKTLPFAINCGGDDVCTSDLQVKSYFVEMRDQSTFVIGSLQSVSLKIEVENLGESAYETEVLVEFPENIHLSRKPSECTEVYGDKQAVHLQCFVANPLKMNAKSDLVLGIDVSQLNPALSKLEFIIKCNTSSNEHNVDDNEVTVILPLTADGDIGVAGWTNEDQILFRSSENKTQSEIKELIHTFEVFKNGHTPIESVLLEIGIPLLLENEPFVNITSIKPTISGDSEQYYGDCIYSESASYPFDYQNIGSVSKNFALSCEKFPCNYVQCKLGPFIAQDIGIVAISLAVNLSSIKELVVKQDLVDYITQGNVIILDPGYVQPLNHVKDFTMITTRFINEGPPPGKAVEIWIIVLCVIVGVLLLLVIILILYKVGFFRRKEKEEMEKISRGDTLLPSEDTS